jgi:hypothetical protein
MLPNQVTFSCLECLTISVSGQPAASASSQMSTRIYLILQKGTRSQQKLTPG